MLSFPQIEYDLDNQYNAKNVYSKTCLKRPLKKTKNRFSRLNALNAGQKYCRMLQESFDLN